MDKKALHSLSYGLYVVSSTLGNQDNGQIANAVFQVTSEPPRIAVCINRENYTHEIISQAGVLAVSVLEQETPMELIARFGFKSGREIKKFDQLPFHRGVTGVPLLVDHSIAFIEAEVHDRLEVGTHTLFCATVIDCDLVGKGEPLTYAYYQTVKKGGAPRSAPTYIGEKQEKADIAAASAGEDYTKYRCTICGYIYDPLQGDAEGDIPAGTPFAKLPSDWVCPLCGAAKDEFVKEA